MTIKVRADDGTTQTFPKGTSPAAVRMAMLAYNNKADWGGLAARVASAIQQGGERVADVAGKIWSSPNTALGLAAAGPSYLAGRVMRTDPKFQIGDNAVQLLNSPWNIDERPYTLGNVQVYPPKQDPDHSGPQYGARGIRTGAHEAGHSQQAQLIGPMYLPAYLAGEGARRLLGIVHPMRWARTNLPKVNRAPAFDARGSLGRIIVFNLHH